ncbi:kinetochore-associated protein KNL-2 homolog [Lycium barbarum]|uniref:kinetochore-associated protein KNL-2 homolog n=1 Tax=Lycium barbarum TaxID=112863 RepID=UPI00293E4E19|nr:kinetochore-associated protein KNL-2 homolog [Lycium barbarum]
MTPANSSILSSSFLREVYLYDWWLIKVETGDGSKQLGVGGLTAKERQDERVFHSAAIAKRHDSVTFVTVDGITILVGGFINRGRTLQNGFSSEVCNLFLFGFPYDWEEYAALSFGESTNEDADFGTSDFSESVNGSADRASISMSIDHLSANALRDLLLSTGPEARKLRKSIFNEIVQKYGTNPFKGGEANQKSGNPVTTENPSPNGSPSQKKKAKTSQKQEDSCIPDAKSGEEDFQEATPEDMPKKSVLGKILYKSGGSASIDGENSCLNKNMGNQVIITGPSLDETPRQMKKTAVNLRKEDDNHVLQKCNDERGAVIDKNGLSSSPRLTRGKASLYKKTKVDQKQEDKRDVHKVESGQGDFGIVDHATSSSNGPLTRSRAQKQVKRTRSRRK